MDNYQSIALKTASPNAGTNPDVSPDLVHAVLGLCDESLELIETAHGFKNQAEELGDLIWFCALANRSINPDSDFSKIMTHVNDDSFHTESKDRLAMFISRLSMHTAGLIKKPYAYSKKRVLPVDEITQNLSKIVARVSAYASKIGVTLDYLQESNITKLQGDNGRYKDGVFSADDEVNRDADSELEHIKESTETVTNLGHLPVSVKEGLYKFIHKADKYAVTRSQEEYDRYSDLDSGIHKRTFDMPDGSFFGAIVHLKPLADSKD